MAHRTRNGFLIQVVALVLLAPAACFAPVISVRASPTPTRHGLPTAAAPQAGPIAPRELESFLDSFFAAQLAETHTPGAVVVFVQDGELLLSKGYGLAQVEQAVPMDATETVMRVGSISKLFVATAVMQLVEQGRLDLHADVNRYLTAFQVDATFPEPITLARLLTHTSGLDEAWDTSTDPSAIPPLGAYLAGTLRRIMPPGEIWYYSGVGYALAAYIVETVSGMPFDQYVDDHILQPLGMAHTRYLRTTPPPESLATGYLYQDGAYLPQPVDYYGDYPSSNLVSTAGDMARFMIAHLENGCYGRACILRPETVAEMHRRRFAPHPQMDGHTYGFREDSANGQRLIGHSGAIRGFGAILTLLPEHRLGYFMAFNQECANTSACYMIEALRQQFADRFFPASSVAAPLPTAPPSPNPVTPPEELAGEYRFSIYRHNPAYRSTVWKLWALDQDVTVTADGDGIRIDGVPCVETAPLLFQAESGGKRIAFVRNGRGEIAYLFRPPAYEKLAWYETGAVVRAMFYGWGVLWACMALTGLAALFLRRRCGGQPGSNLERRARLTRVAHGLPMLIGLLNVAFLASLIRPFWVSTTATRAWLVLPLVSAGLTVALVVALVAALVAALAGVMVRRKTCPVVWQVYDALVVLASAVFMLVLNAWNLIGFKLS